VRFAVRRSRGVLIAVHLDDGQPVPAGAIARIAGRVDEFPFAYGGEAYLTDVADGEHVEVTWRDQRCTFPVSVLSSHEPLPRVTGLLCSGVKR
jgi:outer membrane usher protein